nr:hypothetical protein JVH1_5219 [Rhodococcus sp. JVH1]
MVLSRSRPAPQSIRAGAALTASELTVPRARHGSIARGVEFSVVEGRVRVPTFDGCRVRSRR